MTSTLTAPPVEFVDDGAPTAPRWDAAALTLLVTLVVAKAVLPPFVSMLQTGRPLPGSALAQTSFAAAIGQATTVAIVALTGTIILSRRSSIDRSLIGPSWILYLAVCAVASWHAGYLPIGTTVTSFAVLVAAMHLTIDSRTAARVISYVLGGVTLACIVLDVVNPTLARFGSDLYDEPGRGSRVAGILEQPNQLGLVAGLTVICAIVVVRERGHRVLGASALTIGVIGLLMSESYTSWLATLAGGGIVFLVPSITPVSGIARTARTIVGLGGLAGIALVIFETVHTDATASTVNGRQLVWAYVEAHWQERPLLGHGVGVWSDLISMGSVPTWAVHAHNQVLNTLYVGGVLSLVALAFAVLLSAIRSARAWRRGLGACAGLLAFQLIRSYAEVPFELMFAGVNLIVPLIVTACRLDDVRRRAHAE